MGVSIDGGTPKSSMFKGFSLINHPFWGSLISGNLRNYSFTTLGKLTVCELENGQL